MKVRRLLFLLFLFCSFGKVWSQNVAIKTNLLYGGVAKTPNLGLELALHKRLTLNISGGYNPFGLNGSQESNEKMVHFIVSPELRYWTCQRFNGHYWGLHAFYTAYNLSQKKFPLLFGSDSEQYRFEGTGMGGGISYGYQWVLGKHWNIEFTLSVGAGYLTYDRYTCAHCGDKLESKATKLYYGPTKAGISLVYLIR